MAAPDDAPDFVPVDPYRLARNEVRAAQLKRFFKAADVVERAGAFCLVLDGRDARTPARQPIALPTATAAALLAAEWNRQGEVIRPGEMPATRLANSVIDGVARSMADVQAEIVRYGGSDLVCYRAEGPADLVRRQAAAWDPVLAWARERWRIRLHLTEGVVHVTQPDHARAALDEAVTAAVGANAAAPFRLGALHVMTTLTGSAVLALAVLCDAFAPADVWDRAHVDEDYQISRWGEDAEAVTRRAHRWTDFRAAAALAAAVAPQA